MRHYQLAFDVSFKGRYCGFQCPAPYCRFFVSDLDIELHGSRLNFLRNSGCASVVRNATEQSKKA
jgi:hypothetical protein